MDAEIVPEMIAVINLSEVACRGWRGYNKQTALSQFSPGRVMNTSALRVLRAVSGPCGWENHTLQRVGCSLRQLERRVFVWKFPIKR